MTEEEAIAALDALAGDREDCHIRADEILRAVVPEAVAAAYSRAYERVGFWYA